MEGRTAKQTTAHKHELLLPFSEFRAPGGLSPPKFTFRMGLKPIWEYFAYAFLFNNTTEPRESTSLQEIAAQVPNITAHALRIIVTYYARIVVIRHPPPRSCFLPPRESA